MNAHAITAAITIKNADSNASFSSVTAAIEPATDSATTVKKYFQGCYYFLTGEERGGGACPGTLCVRFALQYGLTNSNLLPTGLQVM